ncbi:FtsQ-type POTRA domain-containing protein [Verrucomicrobiota bacterium sgz303538]
MKEVAKPYRNKRVSRPHQRRQQHLLEVSVRASKAREQRVRRVIGFLFKCVLLAALLGGAWIGAREAIQRFFWQNPSLFLTDVRVDTDGTLTREQILSTASVLEGRNIFRTDLAAARSALDHLPQVERVEIQRTLPNRLDILITERQPIAWVAAPGDADPSTSERSFLVDTRGYVMKSRKLLPEYVHLPIIAGAETENLVAGQKVSTFEMQAALELLRLNADSTRWQVRKIDISKGYCLVVTDRNRAKITFGLDRIDAQLTRLYRLLDFVQPTRQEIRTVNLFVERNTPVTFVEPIGEEPAGESEPVTPSKPETKAKSTADGVKAKPDSKEKPVAISTPAAKKSEATTASKQSKPKASPTPAKKTSVDSLKKPFRM